MSNSSDNKSYTVCKVMKLKSIGSNGRYSVRSAGEHNLREYNPENCDKDKQYLNRDIVALPKKINGETYTYQGIVRKTIKDAQDAGTMHKVRPDAVYAIELLLGFTPPPGKEWKDIIKDKDLDRWCEENKKWVEERFGKNNLKHLVLHMDESTPHLHALIVPIDEKGRLCAKNFIDGPGDMSKLQTEYANKVGKQFGLSRGVSKKNVKSKNLQKELFNSHATIQEFKESTIGKAIIDEEYIKAKDNEKDEIGHLLPEYEERMIQDFQTASFQFVARENSLKQEAKEEIAKLNKELNVKYDDIDDLQRELNNTREKLKKEKEEQDKKYQKQEREFNKFIGTLKDSHKSIHEIQKDFAFFDTLNRALKNHPDKEYSKKMYAEINHLVQVQHDKDKVNSKALEKIGNNEDIR